MNTMKNILIVGGILLALLCSLSSCHIYLDEQIEMIAPPQIEQDTIKIPDWDIINYN